MTAALYDVLLITMFVGYVRRWLFAYWAIMLLSVVGEADRIV